MVPDTWGDVWTTRHHVMTRLARYFHVVWMDPAREWRDVWLRGRRSGPSLNPQVPEFPGFHLYRPGRWLPTVYRPRVVGAALRRARLRRAAGILRGAGARNLLFYLWRPEFGYALDLLPGLPSCYHVDDEYTFSDRDVPIPPDEERLLRRADRVIVHSPRLLEKKGPYNPRTLVVPNGVDYEAYATPAAEPADLEAVPRPRIGYVGVLKHQLDFALLAVLAERHPEWSFVFVGPRRDLGAKAALVERLDTLPNVHFLGAKSLEALPTYAQHLDVAMLCYEITDYTNCIYPIKLHEYLATGKPVVGAPIQTLLGFAHVVSLARTADEWSAALTASLAAAESAPEAIEARRAVAREHDWDRLVARVAEAFCEVCGPPDAARFEALASKAPR